jgi:ABC-type glycerol-3-phosphate transport system substrate-binding protein
MKTMMIALAVAGLATAGSAFAQSSAPAQLPAQAPAPTTLAQTGQWVPPDGPVIAPKTRAEVYQELVKSEQNGQLDYLNRTLYWHH